MGVYRTALVALDFSDACEQAFDEAVKLAEPADLHVVHVLRPLHPGDPGVVWDRVSDEARIAAARKHLETYLAEKGRSVGTMHVRVGDPGNQIAACANEIGAEVVVVASHGRSGLSHLLLGSVAERVARLCKSPVLIVKHTR